MSDKLTSLLVNHQVPEFVREEYPLFISFLEAYYEYLEQKQGTQLNDLTACLNSFDCLFKKASYSWLILRVRFTCMEIGES